MRFHPCCNRVRAQDDIVYSSRNDVGLQIQVLRSMETVSELIYPQQAYPFPD